MTAGQIPLFGRRNAIRGYAMADEADLPLLREHRWYLRSDGYAGTNLFVAGRWRQQVAS